MEPSPHAIIAELKASHDLLVPIRVSDMFAADSGRFQAHSIRTHGLLFDHSRVKLTDDVLRQLFDLARDMGVERLRDRMAAGETVNVTESRAALHMALRGHQDATFAVDDKNVMPEVVRERSRMVRFAQAIRSGELTGLTGKRFTDIVTIGIGGSHLGPAMAIRALAPHHDGPAVHFVSNVDAAAITDTLAPLDPSATLFVIASKTFTTVETMTNAATARQWVINRLGEAAMRHHFAALSSAPDKVVDFGIADDRTFGFWEWVGGRFSLWSSIGLPIVIALGEHNFAALLAGARQMDHHFLECPMERNIPIVQALIGFWHRTICRYSTRAIVPYDQRLDLLPAYLQQLDMESNGKGVDAQGRPVDGPTGPIVWGAPGTDAQHAFFQLIHQGTDVVPVEFLVAAHGHEDHLSHHHRLLLTNCLAQADALMQGRSMQQVEERLRASGLARQEIARLAPHRVFAGDRPSTLLVYHSLTPAVLGNLIALFEHRTVVEGALWGVNSFDQWGVELGKELATGVASYLDAPQQAPTHLRALISAIDELEAPE